MTTDQRRLALRVALKLLGLFALLAVAVVLLDSLSTEAPARKALPPLQLSLDTVAPGTLQRIPWAGGNLLLLHRTPETMQRLAQNAQRVEPAGGAVASGAFLLLYDRGGDLGCPLQWHPPGSSTPPYQPWHGGFRDQCLGIWYDAAGRLFSGQQSARALQSPPYTVESGLLLVGGNGDNARPEP